MPVVALVFLGFFLFFGIGVQGYLQYRRTGYNVIRGLYRRPLSKEWWIGESWTIGFLLIALSAVLELLDASSPMAALSGPTRFIGVALALAGFTLVEWGVAAMGRSWRVDVSETERGALVTAGPFAIVRNPIYSSMVLLATGLALIVPSPFSLLGVGCVILGLELQVRVLEEPSLLRVHGRPWQKYASSVGRFLPGVGKIRRPSE